VTGTTEPHDFAKPGGSGSDKRANLVTAILAMLMVAGIIALTFSTCGRDKRLRTARDAFFEPLVAGDFQAAYAQLSSERRQHTSFSQFKKLVDHPAFLLPEGGTYDTPYEYHPGWCMVGRVELPDGEWKIELFVVEEHDQVRVHSLALQRPANVQLAKLLPECGYDERTRSGYTGPAIEHSTAPTRH
jgi:hypothetical protein